tara:strand:- start:12 stop:884 length:873 start_codon:yes stop_codon:yes gene_type:complete
MKAEVFEGAILKGSNDLYIVSENLEITAPHNSFLKIGSSDILFKVEGSKKTTIKRHFELKDKETINIKGIYEGKILPGDIIKIYFDEYVTTNVNLLKSADGHKEGDVLYCQGGLTSSSSLDLTGKLCQLIVEQVNKEGQISKLRVFNPGLYIKTPETPVIAINEANKPVEVELEFDLSDNASSIERNVSSISSSLSSSEISLSYPLPEGVSEGEVIIEKQIIHLDREYTYESTSNELCSITQDFSPNHKLPLMAPNNPSFHAVYNKAIEMLEEKLSEMERKIHELERRAN